MVQSELLEGRVHSETVTSDWEGFEPIAFGFPQRE